MGIYSIDTCYTRLTQALTDLLHTDYYKRHNDNFFFFKKYVTAYKDTRILFLYA